MKIIADHREFYDRVWKEWDDMEQYAPTPRHLRNFILSFVRKCNDIAAVCDIGCGNGFVLEGISELNKDYILTGIELSEAVLKKAKKRVPNSTFIKLDIEKESLNQKFDLVICSQVLEHIQNDILALRNIYNMTNKYFVLTVPTGRFDSTSRLMGHYRNYSVKEIKDKLHTANFEILEERIWGFPFHSLYKHTLNLLPDIQKKKIGFGKYNFLKKQFCKVLYWLFFLNIFPLGNDIILLTKKCSK